MLCIDLCCGLGGWAEGFLAEGWDVIGFDIERHRYMLPDMPDNDAQKHTKPVERRGWTQGCAVSLGPEGAEAKPRTRLAEYPAQLILQNVLTLHGAQFRNADCIVASPPCQKYSYMAMPWSRAKAQAAEIRADIGKLIELNRLFYACFDIQAQASRAAGRYIPLVVENVKGAQPWVGRAAWHYGSYYLWGDVPALMPMTLRTVEVNPARGHFIKQPGLSGPAWFDKGAAGVSSRSSARKAASAQIAKIPFELASYIARVYKPDARRFAA